jgi:hypothetical protein
VCVWHCVTSHIYLSYPQITFQSEWQTFGTPRNYTIINDFCACAHLRMANPWRHSCRRDWTSKVRRISVFLEYFDVTDPWNIEPPFSCLCFVKFMDRNIAGNYLKRSIFREKATHMWTVILGQWIRSDHLQTM